MLFLQSVGTKLTHQGGPVNTREPLDEKSNGHHLYSGGPLRDVLLADKVVAPYSPLKEATLLHCANLKDALALPGKSGPVRSLKDVLLPEKSVPVIKDVLVVPARSLKDVLLNPNMQEKQPQHFLTSTPVRLVPFLPPPGTHHLTW